MTTQAQAKPANPLAAQAATNGTPAKPRPKRERVGRAGALAITLGRTVKILESKVKGIAAKERYTFKDGELDLFDTARSDIGDALLSLDHARNALLKVPADWRPPSGNPNWVKGGERAPTLEPGTPVCVREKARPRFDGVLAADELTNLTVVETRKGHVVVQTAAKERLILKRGEVQPIA